MKRALAYPSYRDAKPFPAPDGIVSVDIDPRVGYAGYAVLPHS